MLPVALPLIRRLTFDTDAAAFMSLALVAATLCSASALYDLLSSSLLLPMPDIISLMSLRGYF